jgi:hypothetical protein
MKISAMVIVLAVLSAIPAFAQTNGWGPIFDQDRFGIGQGACWARGENSACLMLTCRGGQPFEIAVMAYGGGFGETPQVPVFIRVDGGPVHEIRMRPLNLFGYQHAAVAYDPSQHAALIAALRTGGVATVAINDPTSNPLPYVLGNRPDRVDAAMASCGVSPLSARPAMASTPANDPTRFVPVDPALRDPQATALAQGLLADLLASEPGTEVSASIAVLPDGRRIVVAEHGVSTNSYGITGVGTYVFTAEPGQPFRRAYATTGAAVWLDTARLSDGFPDLWVANYRGVAQPYGVWRHIGGRYMHQENVPVR